MADDAVRTSILEALRNAETPLTTTTLAARAMVKPADARKALGELLDARKVAKLDERPPRWRAR